MRRTPNLALFRRSLLTDGRQKMPYIFRFGLVATILLSLFGAHIQSLLPTATAVGRSFFISIIFTDLVFITLAGVSLFSSAIAEEHDDQTLGLLVMTGLTPLDMLLNKAVSKLVLGIMLLAAQLPFTLLAITLGGVSLRQIIAAHLALAAFLTCTCGIAVFFSVIARSTLTAAVGTLIGMVAFFVLPLIVGLVRLISKEMSKTFGGGATLNDTLDLAYAGAVGMSPFVRVSEIMKTGFRGSMFDIQFTTNIAVGLLFFAMGWAMFDVFNRRQSTPKASRPLPRRKRRTKVAILAPTRAWPLAVAWKDFYFNGGGVGGVVGRLLAYTAVGVVPVLISLASQPITRNSLGYYMMVGGVCFLVVELTFLFGSLFSSEVHGKTHGSLMSLPYAPRELIAMKTVSIVPTLMPVLLFICAGDLIGGDGSQILDVLVKPQALGLFLHLALYLVAVSLLSLYMRYGAFFVALLLMLPFNIVKGILDLIVTAVAMGGGSPVATLIVMSVQVAFEVMIIGVLLFLLADRMKSLATST
jgi:hypothetical protein